MKPSKPSTQEYACVSAFKNNLKNACASAFEKKQMKRRAAHVGTGYDDHS